MAKTPDATPHDRAAEPDLPIVTDDEVERIDPQIDPWDDGPPTRAQHSWNHTRRPVKTEADRGQGPKTRAANREKVKGSRLHNP